MPVYGPISLPQESSSRTVTDKAWTIGFIISFLLFIPFFGYALSQANFGSGIIPNPSQEKLNDIEKDANTIGKSTFVQHLGISLLAGIFFSALIVVTFRYQAKAFVWALIIVVHFCCFAFLCFLWYYIELTYVAIMASIFWIILIILTIALRGKINLICVLIEVSGQALFSAPTLLNIYLLNIFIYIILEVLYLTVAIVFINAVVIKGIERSPASPVLRFGLFYFIVMAMWLSEIVQSFYYFIISRTASKFYFSLNRENLNSPVMDSMQISFRFHAGTLIFGSLLIVLFRVIRWALRRCRCCTRCCSGCYGNILEKILIAFTKISFTVTALYGYDFIKAGKRAVELIRSNAGTIISTNTIGHFVLGFGFNLITLLTVVVGVFICQDQNFIPIYAVVGLTLTWTLFVLFTAILDTITICFCEDVMMNDGQNKPFAMPKELYVYKSCED